MSLLKRIQKLLENASLWLGPIFWILILIRYPAHFNNDDNFSQFTPAINYGLDAIFSGKLPWIMPVDFVTRLAEAPYYSIFNPIMLLIGFIRAQFSIPDFLTVGIWCLTWLLLINWRLVIFVRDLVLPWHLRAVVVLAAGAASYAATFASSWYYVLPYQFLLLVKIEYWMNVVDRRPDRPIFLHLVAIFFAVYGGNPQLFLYVLIIEAIFILLNFSIDTLKAYILWSFFTALILSPIIYCWLNYWIYGWRSVYSFAFIDIFFHFRKIISPRSNPSHGGVSIWTVLCCTPLLLQSFYPIPKMVKSIGLVVVLLLLLSGFDVGAFEFHGKGGVTAPLKWWFFGSVLTVLGAALWMQNFGAKSKFAISGFIWLITIIYVNHSYSWAGFKWSSLDYVAGKKSESIIRQYVDRRSRIIPLTPERSSYLNPSGNLSLNTWLGLNVVMASGYETLQPRESLARELRFNPTLTTGSGYLPSLRIENYKNWTPDFFKDIGVGYLWIDRNYFDDPSGFEVFDGDIVYSDSEHWLFKLNNSGVLISCLSQCQDFDASFQADRIEINFTRPVFDTIILRINPLKNFVIQSGSGVDVDRIPHSEWLAFKGDGSMSYAIRYRDDGFLFLLLLSHMISVAAIIFYLTLRGRLNRW